MDLQIKRGKVVVKSTAAVQLQRKIKRGKVVVKSATAVLLQRITQLCNCSGSAAAVQLQRCKAEQRNDVSRRITLTKKLLKITRCQFHSGSIP